MNNRKELIERWKDIASAVFKAENRIIDEWLPRLNSAKKKEENAVRVVDDYLTAIAEEIIDNSNMKFEDEE